MLFYHKSILRTRLVILSGLLSSACLLTSCASVNELMHPKLSALPLLIIDKPDSRFISVHAYEISGKLRISGTVRGSRTKLGHIDFELVDRNGGIVSSSKTYINPSSRIIGSPENIYYSTSFPLDVAAKAKEIRVVFHRISHGHQTQ
jgi:hypothetical protein